MSNRLVTVLFRHVFPDHLASRELDIYPRISYPEQNIVEAHEESTEQQ